MADRNDALLLKLGYKKLSPSSHAVQVGDASFWDRPDGVRLCYTPRPYDNLQDAVDCVPEGWSTSNVYQDTEVGKWLWMLESEDREVFKWAETPAEALSEAISKAVSHVGLPYDLCDDIPDNQIVRSTNPSRRRTVGNTRKENSHE